MGDFNAFRYQVLVGLCYTSQSNMVSRWQMLNCFPRFLEKTYSTLLLFYDALKNYRYIQLFLTSSFRIALVVLLVSDILWTRNTIEQQHKMATFLEVWPKLWGGKKPWLLKGCMLVCLQPFPSCGSGSCVLHSFWHGASDMGRKLVPRWQEKFL